MGDLSPDLTKLLQTINAVLGQTGSTSNGGSFSNGGDDKTTA